MNEPKPETNAKELPIPSYPVEDTGIFDQLLDAVEQTDSESKCG